MYMIEEVFGSLEIGGLGLVGYGILQGWTHSTQP